MLYHTMKPEFIFQLFSFGVFALLFAILAVYKAHNHQQFIYKKLLSVIFMLICADFTVLFIRVTAPYKSLSDFLFNTFIILTIVTMGILLIFVTLYLKQKKNMKKSINFDILNYIDDYVLIFDQNGEVVLSTCPKDLEKKVSFNKNATTHEIEFNSEHFIVSFSSILKNNITIGVVGIFYNITTEKNLLRTLSEKINKLSEINENLLQEVNIDDVLQIAKQRRQLSFHIQEEIDKKITTLIRRIAEFENDTEQNAKINNLTLLADSLRLILADIRKIVYGR